MTTPSGWYDKERRNARGHDEMQLEVWRYLKALHDRSYVWRAEPADDDDAYFRLDLQVERPFMNRKGVILTFADICEEFYDGRNGLLVVYEIKPVIDSVGGLMRQCSDQHHKISNASYHLSNGRAPRNWDVLLRPAVRANDPKLPILREYLGNAVFIWDGTRELDPPT